MQAAHFSEGKVEAQREQGMSMEHKIGTKEEDEAWRYILWGLGFPRSRLWPSDLPGSQYLPHFLLGTGPRLRRDCLSSSQ